MAHITESDLKLFARKITNLYWPGEEVNDNSITPEYVIFCMKLAQAGRSVTAKIRFFEAAWKASFPSQIGSFEDIIKLISSMVGDSIDGYNKGQIGILAVAGIQNSLGSTVRGYLKYPDAMPLPDIKI